MTSAPPASMRVRSSGRVAWCSRVSIWCPVSNTCTEGALVEKQATEPRTSSGSPIYGRFGALGVFFFAPALVRSRYPGRSCCRSTLSHLGEDRTEQSPTQPRTTQNGPSARTVWQTPLRTSATLQSPTQATCMQSGPKSTHAQTQPLISSACANGALLCISASTWHDPSVRQNSLSRQFSLKTLRFKPPLLHTFGSAAYNRFPNFFHNLNFAR